MTPSPSSQEEARELKGCPTPWCPGDETPYLWQGPTDDFTFICPGCQVEGPYHATEEGARDAWNTRPTPDLGDVDELVEALGNIARAMPYGPDQAWIEQAADKLIALRAALDKNA